MRIEHNSAPEAAKASTGMEAKGAKDVSEQEVEYEKKDYNSRNAYGVKQTMVEKPLFSLDSEIEKIMRAAGDIDVEQIKTQMAVLSNTVSSEDLEKLQENGFSLNDSRIDTIVTVMDKIKMELAKGGMDISVFGEDYSMQQLESITGSVTQARQMASSLDSCGENEIKYMLERELAPTIENLYLAQHSGSAAREADVEALKQEQGMLPQVERAVREAGLAVNDKSLSYASFLLNNDLPVTPDNLRYVDQLKELELPPGEEALETAIRDAVSEGKQPQEALLAEGFSQKERAISAQEVVERTSEDDLTYVIAHGKALTIQSIREAQSFWEADEAGKERRQGNREPENPGGRHEAPVSEQELKLVKARRQLEEIRLTMTVQANLHLLRQGISIETEELEQLVEQLKSVETDYYRSLLSQNGIEDSDENAFLFRETTEKTDALKGLPAYALGRMPIETATVASMYESGNEIKAVLKEAGQAYETMMTEPRADLGDSIRKAFGNVDDLLKDLSLETSEANRRAVRILGYNQMEITTESVAQMKAADQKVQLLFDNMTPSVVMELIRKGVNPLETDLNTLNREAEDIRREMDPGQEEKFGKYLWKLEQKQEITNEERESYIGIFRMLRQIEKTDGAAIGALVNQGGELSLKNLLTAVRSGRNRGIDIKADENFGAVSEIARQEPTITQQVEAAYQTDCAKQAFHRLTQEGLQQSMASGNWQEMTPEQLLWQMKEAAVQEENRESYQKRQLQEFSAVRDTEATVLRMLNDYDLPVTAFHLLAAGQMVNNRNGVFRKLFDPKQLEKNPELGEVKEKLLKEFGEAVKTPEAMAKAQEALAETAEHVMETMINEEEITSFGVRDLKILRQEIEMGTRMAKEETYAVPVMIADEMTNVQLKIVRGREKRGRVDILFETDRLGKVAARLTAEEGRLNGFIASDSQEPLNLLKEQEESMKEALGQTPEYDVRIDFIQSKELDLNAFSNGVKGADQEAQKDSDAYRIQTKQLYGMAKTFLEAVKRM